MGYTLQGILEVGLLCKRSEFIEAVKRSLRPLLANDWSPANLSSCLTGAAQIAVVCYKLYEHTMVVEYKVAADRIGDFLKVLQVTESPVPGANGALAGSFPILGEYQPGGYPNWVTKYFLDARLLQSRLSQSA